MRKNVKFLFLIHTKLVIVKNKKSFGFICVIGIAACGRELFGTYDIRLAVGKQENYIKAHIVSFVATPHFL